MALVYQYVILGLMSVMGFGSCQMDFGGLAQLSMATGGFPGQNRAPAMASMTGMAGEMSPADLAVLENAVKTIVGKHAEPDLAMIGYASTQGGPPKTLAQITPYVGFMVELAKKKGLQMDDGSIQFPSSSGTPSGTGQGTVLTLAEMQKIISARANKWFVKRSMAKKVAPKPLGGMNGQGGTGGVQGMGGLGGMGGMGGMGGLQGMMGGMGALMGMGGMGGMGGLEGMMAGMGGLEGMMGGMAGMGGMGGFTF